jgi:hypothetical protein
MRDRAPVILAEIGLPYRGIVLHHRGRAARDRRTRVEHDDVIRDAHHDRHVVLDEHDRDAGIGDAAQQLGEPLLVGAREPRRGLIEQQHARRSRERARNLDVAPIDMRQTGCASVHVRAIADEREQRLGPSLSFFARRGAAAELAARLRDDEVLEHGQAAEQLRGLIGACKPGARDAPRGLALDRFLSEPDSTRIGPVEAAEQVEHGRLAGAVRPDQARHAARRGGERDVGRGLSRRRTRSSGLRRGASGRSPAAPAALRVRAVAQRERGGARAGARPSPTIPSGAIHSTTSSSAPKKSRRYSASPASTSGSSTTSAAPASGPVTVPAPPMITTSTNRIDCENVNVEGVTKAESAANSAPASPAHAAKS